MIVFQNAGEIDMLTVTTFGCSVKESSNPIGMFGTGLKYALGVLLRTGHKVFIQSGAMEVEVTAAQDSIRGKEFELIMVGDTRAGFTTQLGKLWDVWMAYRELHCNAKDEPDSSIYTTGEHPAPVAGFTRVIVSGEPMEKAHQSRAEFILQSQPLFKIGGTEVHPKSSDALFYRGIKVMNLPKPSLFTYNYIHTMELTEDRTAKDVMLQIRMIGMDAYRFAERSLLETILIAPREAFESDLDLNWSCEPGADFIQTVGDLQRSSLGKINMGALHRWRELTHNFIEPKRINASRVQLATLERAIAFCEKMGFPLRDQYPIFIVETLGEGGIVAMADRHGKQIFLAERLFQSSGTKGVASALLEEYIHLRFGYDDCTRQMQNFLFEKLVTLGEEMTGEPL